MYLYVEAFRENVFSHVDKTLDSGSIKAYFLLQIGSLYIKNICAIQGIFCIWHSYTSHKDNM